MRTIQTFIPVISSLALAACGPGGSDSLKAGGAKAGCLTRAYQTIGGAIDLVDHTGRRVTQADFMGKPSLIYFGFTHCPDICPGTLVAIRNAYDRLPDNIEPPQTLLITVDPERDTVAALSTYVSINAFPNNLVGLTGTAQQIAAAADEFAVQYERVDAPDSVSEYTMDHTSILYLMDEAWHLKAFFTPSDSDPKYMAECLAEHLG